MSARKPYTSLCGSCGHPQRVHGGHVGSNLFSCPCGCEVTGEVATAVPVTEVEWQALAPEVRNFGCPR